MGRRILYLLLAAAACITLFARFYNYFPGDQPLLEWFQTWRHPVVTDYMEAVSFIGRSWLIVGLAGFVVLGLFVAGRRREGFAATGIVAILLLSPLLKLLVDRPRPPLDLAGIANPLSDPSFPSGHAFQSLVLFAFLIFLATILVRTRWMRWSVQVFLVVLILAIGASRVYLNAHWPSDIVGAYIIGGFFLAVLFRCYRRADPVAAMDSGNAAMPVSVSEIESPAYYRFDYVLPTRAGPRWSYAGTCRITDVRGLDTPSPLFERPRSQPWRVKGGTRSQHVRPTGMGIVGL